MAGKRNFPKLDGRGMGEILELAGKAYDYFGKKYPKYTDLVLDGDADLDWIRKNLYRARELLAQQNSSDHIVNCEWMESLEAWKEAVQSKCVVDLQSNQIRFDTECAHVIANMIRYWQLGRMQIEARRDQLIKEGDSSMNLYSYTFDSVKRSQAMYKDLTKEDLEYIDYLSKGKFTEALQMVQGAAMKAMPDTVVKHPVYRRDSVPDIHVYDPNFKNKTDAGRLGRGIYFFGNEEEAQASWDYGPYLRGFFINVQGFYEMPQEIYEGLAMCNDLGESKTVTKTLKDAHRKFEDRITDEIDGVVYNAKGQEEWCVLKPNLVKLASITRDDNGRVIPLSYRFDFTKDDVRY